MRNRIPLAVAVVVLSSCLDSTSPTDPILVVPSAATSTVAAGGEIVITLTIYNRDFAPHLVHAMDCQGPFEILNSKGEVVGPRNRSCAAVDFVNPPIPPRSSREYFAKWAGDSLGWSLQYLAPGAYSIRPRVKIDDGSFVHGNLLPITLTP